MKSNLFSAFNTIKNLHRNPLHERGIQIMNNVHRNLTSKVMNWFMSSLVSAQNNFKISEEVDESAKEQSTLLTLSVYFSNWAKHTKENKLSNRILKFRYFKELKKLLAMKKKRDLSEMLTMTHDKIKDIDKVSSNFCELKKNAVKSLISELKDDLGDLEKKKDNVTTNINKVMNEKKNQYHQLALLKISHHLKGKVEKAFTTWRQHNRKINKFKLIFYTLHSKLISDINYAFSCLQKRKFEKLKLSIADKIESCEFSYNYLVDENKHIKGVLDTKTL